MNISTMLKDVFRFFKGYSINNSITKCVVQLDLFLLVSRFTFFFFVYIHIKTQVNRNFSTSTFFFWVFRWTLRARNLILFDSSNYKNKKTFKKLNNNNSCNNNFKYCFNKLYYVCKHLIILIIVGRYNQRH
jgi:hypothetical protein